MKRETKKRSFEKGYYKRNPCKEVFTCKVCGWLVTPEGAGSGHRNHCPNCLASLHLDVDPVAVWVRKGGEWAVIHRCRRCGALSSNRVAADDNPLKLLSIALGPLAAPPFPVERIREMARLMGGSLE